MAKVALVAAMVAKRTLLFFTPLLLLSSCKGKDSHAALRPSGGIAVHIEEVQPEKFAIRNEVYLDSLLDTHINVQFIDSSKNSRFSLQQAHQLVYKPVTDSVLAIRAAYRGLFQYVGNECLDKMAVTMDVYSDEVAYANSRDKVMTRLRQTAFLSDKSRTSFGINCAEDEKRSSSSRSSRSYGG